MNNFWWRENRLSRWFAGVVEWTMIHSFARALELLTRQSLKLVVVEPCRMDDDPFLHSYDGTANQAVVEAFSSRALSNGR